MPQQSKGTENGDESCSDGFCIGTERSCDNPLCSSVRDAIDYAKKLMSSTFTTSMGTETFQELEGGRRIICTEKTLTTELSSKFYVNDAIGTNTLESLLSPMGSPRMMKSE